MTALRYGSCVGSWDRITRWVAPHVEGREFIGLSGQPSLAVAYNRILDTYAADLGGPVVLLHDDLEITDGAFEAKVSTIFDDPANRDVALVGVCGGTSFSLAWWNGPTVGHQRTDAGLLDFGARTGDVNVLEGSVLAFSPWAVSHLRYDERFPGFRSADEVCQTARFAGKRLIVADIDTHHHTRPGFSSEAVAADWHRGEAIYQARRQGRDPEPA